MLYFKVVYSTLMNDVRRNFKTKRHGFDHIIIALVSNARQHQASPLAQWVGTHATRKPKKKNHLGKLGVILTSKKAQPRLGLNLTLFNRCP